MSQTDTTRLEATYDALRLTKRVHTDDVASYRSFREHAGDFERIVESDGSWTIDDQSAGGNHVTVVPPQRLEPAFVTDDFHVRDYRERGNDGGFIRDVSLDLVRAAPRDPENPSSVLTESASGTEWLFEFSRGTIATASVSVSDHASGDRVTFELALSGPQAEVVMESATRLDAVVEESVPDGDDFWDDTTAGGRNEVVVTAGGAVSTPAYLEGDGGTFAVTSWRVRSPVAGLRYAVTIEAQHVS